MLAGASAGSSGKGAQAMKFLRIIRPVAGFAATALTLLLLTIPAKRISEPLSNTLGYVGIVYYCAMWAGIIWGCAFESRCAKCWRDA